MRKIKGYIGQVVERKAVKKESLTGYEMTAEYRDAVIADIKSIWVFAFTSKLTFDEDTITLTFNSEGGIGKTIVEKVILICDKHNALFTITGTKNQRVEVSIFKKISETV